MRTIRISDEVWREIAKHGEFGETEEDALRRAFKMRPSGSDQDDGLSKASAGRPAVGHFARERMHAKVYREDDGSYLKVRFHESGEEQNFDLPREKSDKRAIRAALEAALSFGEKHGA